jgi:hypothetical protein
MNSKTSYLCKKQPITCPTTEHLTEDEFYYKIVTNQEENIDEVILKLRKLTNSVGNITKISVMDKTCFYNLVLK